MVSVVGTLLVVISSESIDGSSKTEVIAELPRKHGKIPPNTWTEKIAGTWKQLPDVLTRRGFFRPSAFPPGPQKLPFVGTFPWVGNEHLVHYSSRVKKLYGPVLGLFPMDQPFVVISDAKLGREAMNQDVFCGRQDNPTTRYLRDGTTENPGLINSNNELWSSQRKFTLKTLRDFGFGKKGSEGILQEEAMYACEYLRQFDGQDFHIKTFFNVPVINVLWQMVASKRFEFEDPFIDNLMDDNNKMVSSKRTMYRVLPLFHVKFPGMAELSGLKIMKDLYMRIIDLFKALIKEHKETRDPSEPRDFIDVFLNEADKGDPNFNELQLIINIMDLFLAGSETTSTTLKWTVLYLVLFPEVQEKCRKEILEKVGRDRLPSLSDDLLYCEATILEVQRLGAIVPASLIHSTKHATTLGQYKLPQDTLVIVNIMDIMSNPEYFENPHEFRPERFIKDGKINKELLENFMPFGIGRRICLGEALAKNELKIFFLCLLQNIQFGMPKGKEVSSPSPFDYEMGITRIPQHFHVNIQCV